MSGINKVILIGNLGGDPDLKYTTNNIPVANFSIATSESYTKDGKKIDKTEWHRIVLWRKLAEIASQYLTKGSKIYLEGKIETRKYDKNGQDLYITEIIGSQMQMLDSRSENKIKIENSTSSEPVPIANGAEDELPF